MFSWHHYYIIGIAYKRHCTAPISVPLLRWGTCACRDWHTDMPVFLELTSFKDNWLGCYYCREHPHNTDTFTHSGSILWVLPHSHLVLSLQDLHTFGWCPCALYSLYKVYLIENVLLQEWHLAALHCTHHIYIKSIHLLGLIYLETSMATAFFIWPFLFNCRNNWGISLIYTAENNWSIHLTSHLKPSTSIWSTY